MTIRVLLTRVAVCAGFTALLAGAAPASAQIRLDIYVTGLASPLEFVQDPTNRAVQYVVQQGGLIRVIVNGALQPTPFLNAAPFIVSGGEQGLLGLAFAPDYATSGRFFVDFTDTAGNTVVARFKRSAANPLVADPATRFDLRWGGATGQRFIVQPFANHNGGHLAFGPDGYLYVGLGDGGSGGDPQNNSQNPMSFLGKLLRIDVSVADGDPDGYAVPPDNPFVNNAPIAALHEIWSFGLRNPWKFTFDDPAHGGSGAMLIGDVGQNAFEEVDYQAPGVGGRNYGWRIREGLHPFDASQPPAYTPLIDPILEYDHSQGQSITGGYVYRGSAMRPMYRGRYFYADFILGRLWSVSLNPTAGGEAMASSLIDHGPEVGGPARIGNPSAFGVDADGEMYLVSYTSGAIFKIVDTRAKVAGDFDGDGKEDVTVFRPSTATWYVSLSSTNYQQSFAIGWGSSQTGDIPVPADYDGDGIVDLAVWRPANATWYILLSSSNYTQSLAIGWGSSAAHDVLVPADYDGDGKADLAVWRPGNATWYILTSSSNYTQSFAIAWGASTTGDIPVPGDYDGDGKADLAIYRSSNATWYIAKSSANFAETMAIGWGSAATGDVPVPADYDGDGKFDVAVWRPGNATWYILTSSSNYTRSMAVGWGASSTHDVLVPADYDGDGKADIAVWRPGNATWYILTSSSGYLQSIGLGWGSMNDLPLVAGRVIH